MTLSSNASLILFPTSFLSVRSIPATCPFYSFSSLASSCHQTFAIAVPSAWECLSRYPHSVIPHLFRHSSNLLLEAFHRITQILQVIFKSSLKFVSSTPEYKLDEGRSTLFTLGSPTPQNLFST